MGRTPTDAARSECAQVITNRLMDIKVAQHAMRACEWEVSRQKTDVTSKQLAETKKIAAELEQENRMLGIQRKARMKEFLAAEAVVFEQQLNAMGMAFCKER